MASLSSDSEGDNRVKEVTPVEVLLLSASAQLIYFTDISVPKAVNLKIRLRYCSKHSLKQLLCQKYKRSNWCICSQCNQMLC